MGDKYTATWVSHSSIRDFLTCPRLYYLRNVYKDKKTGHKITVMSPSLALGQAVHEVVESLSVLPVGDRLLVSLEKKLDDVWKKVAGELGGFADEKDEKEYKERGKMMLRKIEQYPGPIAKKAVKINQELPHYWLSEKDNIILCGKIDWLEYLEEKDSVHILDFKTGKNTEPEGSLQLPIYLLLVTNTQKRNVDKASYWYLASSDVPEEVELPKEKDAFEQVMEVAKRVALARKINRFTCPKDGCHGCRPLERVLAGEGKLVGTSEYRQDVYVLPRKGKTEQKKIHTDELPF